MLNKSPDKFAPFDKGVSIKRGGFLLKISSSPFFYALWPLIFFIALIPFASTLIQHYADEWHYINSVLVMLKNGDYLAPQNTYVMPELGGIMRFNKPILTYWAILAGFKIFGVSVFSLRICFLLAGSFTVMLTVIMAQTLFAKRAVSDLAALILMTQMGFVFASVRAIPDILVTLFLTLSAYGVFCLLTHNRYRLGWWCFYVGAALAIESKGLLAVVFVVYTWIFLWKVNPQVFAKRRMTHLCAVIIGLLLASGWYVMMWVLHGSLFLQAFLYDQVGLRLHHAIWSPLVNIPMTALSFVVCLLPWSAVVLFIIIQNRGFFRSITPARWQIAGFILGWTVLVVSILGFGNNISSRYLLPLQPLWAIIAAYIILQSSWEWRQRVGRYFLWIMIALLFLVGILDFFIVGQLVGLAVGLLILLISFGLAIGLIRAIQTQRLDFLRAAAVMFFLLMVSTAYPLSLILLPDPAKQIVKSLEIVLPADQKRIDFFTSNRFASNIRLLSQGAIDLHYLVSEELAQTSPLPLLISAKDANKLHLPNAHQRKIVLSRSLENIHPTDFILSIFTWQLADQMRLQSEEYWLIMSV